MLLARGKEPLEHINLQGMSDPGSGKEVVAFSCVGRRMMSRRDSHRGVDSARVGTPQYGNSINIR
jgi:hypothetical protein